MKNEMLVREVRIQRGCGFSRRDDPDVVPTLVCPLCVKEGIRQPHERTATLAISGHIWCNAGCGRYSTIVMRTLRDGEVPLFPCSLSGIRSLTQQTEALGTLRPALAGNGDLFDLVVVDSEQPPSVIGFVLPKLRVDARALAEVAFG